MQNPAVYFEIPVSDMSRATAFYHDVFGYDFVYENIHGNDMAMLPFYDDASGITGALAKGNIYKPSLQGVLIYLHTENIDQTLAKVIAHGGKTLFPKTLSGAYGYVAEFKDSEGNRIGLFQTQLNL